MATVETHGLRTAGTPAGALASDFFDSNEGTAEPLPARRRDLARLYLRDLIDDAKVWFGAGLKTVRGATASKIERVLIVGIEVPARAADIHKTIARLRQGSRHDIVVSITPMLDRGKFANLEAAISAAAKPLEAFDWLVMVDDDIAFNIGFLDDMIAVATAADLSLSQPAHRLLSHVTYSITGRVPGVLARRTNFVEIGPLNLVRADFFSTLIPFPPSRSGYGIDLLWSVAARRARRHIGIIDATPVRHLRPVAGSYDIDAAREEGLALIRAHHVTDNRRDLFRLNERVLTA